MLKNQAIWLIERFLEPKHKNKTFKLLEMTESLFSFSGWLSIYRNQHHSPIQSWHIADALLGIFFDITRCAWPYPYEWAVSNKCTCVCLITCKTALSRLSSFLRSSWLNDLNHFGYVLNDLNHFAYVWPHPLEIIKYIWNFNVYQTASKKPTL